MTTGDETQQAKETRIHVPLAEAVHLFNDAGVFRSERTISRYCENGALHCIKEQLSTGAMGYLVSRESIQDRIVELKQLGMTGHVATGPDASRRDTTGQVESGQGETKVQAAEERAAKAEKERDDLRAQNMQLNIDLEVRKQLLNEAKRRSDLLLEERDGMMRHVGALMGQVKQLGGEPVDLLMIDAPKTEEDSSNSATPNEEHGTPEHEGDVEQGQRSSQ